MSSTLTTKYGLDFEFYPEADGTVAFSFVIPHEKSKEKHPYEFDGYWTAHEIEGIKERGLSTWNWPRMKYRKAGSMVQRRSMWGSRRDWPQMSSILSSIAAAIIEHMETDQYKLEKAESIRLDLLRQIERAENEIKHANRTIELQTARIADLQARLDLTQ